MNIRKLFIGGVIIAFLDVSLFGNYRKALFNLKPPQLILVLGGDLDRERAGARLANELRLPLTISGGSNPEHANWLMTHSGLPSQRVRLDYRAKDTFGNFTTLVDDFLAEDVEHILLITSEDHFARAIAVGWVIIGSRGIQLTGLSVPCSPYCIEEKSQKITFDLVRSFFWVVTGSDLKFLAKNLWPDLFKKA